MVQYKKNNPKLSYQDLPNPFSEKKMCKGIFSSHAFSIIIVLIYMCKVYSIYNQFIAISAYASELADSIQFLFYQFRWTVG